MPVYPNNIPTILIVDDEPFNLEFLEIVLKQQGYNIITASNGRTGRRIAEQKQPDLILLDIMMPDENGFECATVLRLSPETAEIPIIFLSALDDEENTSKGFDAGASDFICKPFNYKEVIHRIRLHLKLTACDRLSKTRTCRPPHAEVQESPFPPQGARATFPPSLPKQRSFIYESVVLDDKSEGHLLLNCPAHCSDNLQPNVRELLAENSGPLFSPSETLRNLGLGLQNKPGGKELFGCYVHLDREDRTLTAVNAGSLPLIFLQVEKTPLLIEKKSGKLGTLGLGLLPCSTYELRKGDRIFMFSRGMLAKFAQAGEAINELMEACHLSAGVDLETACHAAGELLLQDGDAPDGILVGIEA